MGVVVPEEQVPVMGEEQAPSLMVEEPEAPARSEEVAAEEPCAEERGETGIVEDVVVTEGPALTNETLRDWGRRWCAGDHEGLPHISTWNTSRVTDLSWLFHGKSEFNDAIGAWDTSGVTTMQHMFLYARSFNQPLNDLA